MGLLRDIITSLLGGGRVVTLDDGQHSLRSGLTHPAGDRAGSGDIRINTSDGSRTAFTYKEGTFGDARSLYFGDTYVGSIDTRFSPDQGNDFVLDRVGGLVALTTQVVRARWTQQQGSYSSAVRYMFFGREGALGCSGEQPVQSHVAMFPEVGTPRYALLFTTLTDGVQQVAPINLWKGEVAFGGPYKEGSVVQGASLPPILSTYTKVDLARESDNDELVLVCDAGLQRESHSRYDKHLVIVGSNGQRLYDIPTKYHSSSPPFPYTHGDESFRLMFAEVSAGCHEMHIVSQHGQLDANSPVNRVVELYSGGSEINAAVMQGTDVTRFLNEQGCTLTYRPSDGKFSLAQRSD
jgi:hypothetical protein